MGAPGLAAGGSVICCAREGCAGAGEAGALRGALGRALVAFLLPLVETLQRLVDAHRQELQHHVRHAQAALQFLHHSGPAVNWNST